MTDPFNQPAPFASGSAPAPLPRVAARPRRPWLPVAGAVLLAVVAFAGGFVVANATAAKATTGGDGQGGGGGQAFGPNASGRPRGAGGVGGGAAGTVGSVSADQMTLTTAAGGQRIILLTPTTAVTQVSAATKAVSDLTAGETVTVMGTANPDGSVTATRIIIGDLGVFGGRGGFGGPAPSGAASTAP